MVDEDDEFERHIEAAARREAQKKAQKKQQQLDKRREKERQKRAIEKAKEDALTVAAAIAAAALRAKVTRRKTTKKNTRSPIAGQTRSGGAHAVASKRAPSRKRSNQGAASTAAVEDSNEEVNKDEDNRAAESQPPEPQTQPQSSQRKGSQSLEPRPVEFKLILRAVIDGEVVLEERRVLRSDSIEAQRADCAAFLVYEFSKYAANSPGPYYPFESTVSVSSISTRGATLVESFQPIRWEEALKTIELNAFNKRREHELTLQRRYSRS